MNFVLHFFKVLWLTVFNRMYVLFLFLLCWFESPAFQSSSSPPDWMFSNEKARLLSRSRGNDHGVNASVENWILDKQSLSCVAGIAQMVNKLCSFERGMFILLGDVKFIALQRFWGEILDSMSESISDKLVTSLAVILILCSPVGVLTTSTTKT
jgi:hypothetical protein